MTGGSSARILSLGVSPTIKKLSKAAVKVDAFIAEYLVDFNGTRAATVAGYAAKSAHVTASKLLRTPKVREAIEAKRAKQIETADLSAARVLEELRRLAFSDVRSLFDDKGNLRPLHTLTAEQAACIGGVEVVIKNAKAGDNQTDTVHKIKIWDKPRSVEMLAKHFALLTEVVRVDEDASRIEKLMAGRKRVAEARKAPPNDTSPQAGA